MRADKLMGRVTKETRGKIFLASSITAVPIFFFIYFVRPNSVTLVRERTTPTERPPPVGEVSANFCG